MTTAASIRSVSFALATAMVFTGVVGRAQSDVVCHGDPPRQTEDPLSPPCVPMFDGDNGGTTSRGVTAGEIRVVLYNDSGVDGDLSEPRGQAGDEPSALRGSDPASFFRTAAALTRFFNHRFQTYQRAVRVWAVSSSVGEAPSCTSRMRDAERIAAMEPFLVVAFGSNMGCAAEHLAGEYGIQIVGAMTDLPRSLYLGNDPYVWSFMPDLETTAQLSAGFICRKLAGRPASFSPDPTLQLRVRSFGLIYPLVGSQGRPGPAHAAAALQDELQRQCGLEFASVDRVATQGSADVIAILARYKLEGITTVVCYCPVPSSVQPDVSHQMASTALGFFPEWYWDGISGMDRSQAHRAYGDPAHASFGSTALWRQRRFTETYAYQAYRSEEPDATPDERSLFWVYHSLLLAFTGIQAAGPDLTVQTLRQGLHTFNYLDRIDPFTPVGGFGPYGPRALGDHTFIDTGMGWWWDPVGIDDDGAMPGCIRAMSWGVRFYPSAWRATDQDLYVEGAPCAGDIEHGLRNRGG